MQIQSVDRNSFDGGKAQNALANGRGGGNGRGGWVGAAVGAMMMMKKKTKTKTPPPVNSRAAVSREGSGGDVSGRLQFYASSSGGGDKAGAAGGGKGGRRNKMRAHKSNKPSRLNPATAGASQTTVQPELEKGDATGGGDATDGVPVNDSVPATIGQGGGGDSDVGQENPVASPRQRVASMEL